jgi:Putative stress-induced transcription regulator
VRGVLQDGLTAPAHLGAWLRDVRSRLWTRLTDAQLLACTAEDLAAARDLRHCRRTLADAAAHGTRPAASIVAALNAHIRAAPRWRELSWRAEPIATDRSNAPPVTQAMARHPSLRTLPTSPQVSENRGKLIGGSSRRWRRRRRRRRHGLIGDRVPGAGGAPEAGVSAGTSAFLLPERLLDCLGDHDVQQRAAPASVTALTAAWLTAARVLSRLFGPASSV